MDVRTLIEILEEMNPDATVYLSNEHEGCYGTHLREECIIEEEGTDGKPYIGLYQSPPRR